MRVLHAYYSSSADSGDRAAVCSSAVFYFSALSALELTPLAWHECRVGDEDTDGLVPPVAPMAQKLSGSFLMDSNLLEDFHMHRLGSRVLVVAAVSLLPYATAHAYIGPGLTVGVVAIILGTVASIFLAFVGILWYPTKRLIARWRKAAPAVREPRQADEDSDRTNQ